MRGLAAAVGLALLACAAWVRGAEDPPLGAIAERARRERAEQRAKTSGSARTFTNADLKGQSASELPRETPEVPKTAAGPGAADDRPAGRDVKAEKADDQIRAQRRDEIQKEIDEQRLKMRQIDQGTADAKIELSDLTNYTYDTRKEALQRAIDDGQGEKGKAQRAIDALEEEARRLGVPVS